MPLSVFIIIFIDFILSRFLEMFTNSKTYMIDAFPCYCWTYMTLRGCFLRQAQQFRKTNPLHTHFMSIARLQSYSPGGSKTYIHMVFWKFYQKLLRISTQVYSCAEKTVMVARCSFIYFLLSSSIHGQNLISSLQ